ncbi:MAG: hypothetical protein CM15mP23_10160 [Cryomorphaceae bacterium]|nr:MAG: hypothetical protein CM15mP23_10160 [Cryomorphaceae bacterium]
MRLKFSKYHGTGNDFIMVYNYNNSYSFSQSSVKKFVIEGMVLVLMDLLLLRKP